MKKKKFKRYKGCLYAIAAAMLVAFGIVLYWVVRLYVVYQQNLVIEEIIKTI